MTTASIPLRPTGTRAPLSPANIVAATVVQIVKGPVYTGGCRPGIGEWLSAGNIRLYGDLYGGNGRVSGMLGNVGGQSLAFTAGSGGTNGTVTVTGTSCGLSGASSPPKVDVTVSGGATVDVYPSASSTNTGNGITSPCAFTTGVTGGTVTTMAYGPNEGQAGYRHGGDPKQHDGRHALRQFGRAGEPAVQCVRQPGQRAAPAISKPGLPVKSFGQDMGARVSG